MFRSSLLTGATLATLTLTTTAGAADLSSGPVDVWSGYFVGVQGGYSWKDVEADVYVISDDDREIASLSSDAFVGGLYYGRNWQSGNWVFGLDSSISYLGLDVSEENVAEVDTVVEANLLGLSRLKAGYALDNVLIFATGGLATTLFNIEGSSDGDTEDETAFGVGWTLGAGVETKFAENWSVRLEYAFAKIEGDVSIDVAGNPVDIDADLETHIVRAGVAYHF